ncbi:22520_t:CDS:1, partial [Gigaspora rosea]
SVSNGILSSNVKSIRILLFRIGIRFLNYLTILFPIGFDDKGSFESSDELLESEIS